MTNKRTPRQIWDELEKEALDDEIDRAASMTPEEAARELAEAGFDVEAEKAEARAWREKNLGASAAETATGAAVPAKATGAAASATAGRVAAASAGVALAAGLALAAGVALVLATNGARLVAWVE